MKDHDFLICLIIHISGQIHNNPISRHRLDRLSINELRRIKDNLVKERKIKADCEEVE